jgi:hypothetical protein
MRIGCDIDGVLADFNTAFIARVILVTGKDLFPVRPFDIPTWNYPEHYGYTGAEVSAVWESIKADDNFWASLPAYDDTRATLFHLSNQQYMGDDIYFVTARPGVFAKQQTERWLRANGFTNPTVLISSLKGHCAEALALDRYLDDRWENALSVADTPDTYPYLLVRPWNRGNNPQQHGIVEVTTIADFLRQ